MLVSHQSLTVHCVESPLTRPSITEDFNLALTIPTPKVISTEY